jgi:single-strand DNA-binding protein
MADLNVCTFVGRLTKDAVTESIGSNGTQLTKFAIANNTGSGQYARTNFFNVQMWGKQGVALSPYLTKGKQVALTGVLENQKWTGNDGMQHDSWTLTANSLTLLADGGQKKAEVSQDEAVF